MYVYHNVEKKKVKNTPVGYFQLKNNNVAINLHIALCLNLCQSLWISS